MGPRNEIDALGRVAGDVADRLPPPPPPPPPAQTRPAAIAERVFKPLGPVGLPARAIHDGLASAVYAGVRAGVFGAARAAAAGAGLTGVAPQSVVRAPRTAGLVAIANGLIGHELAADDDPLATPLGYWQD